jgi:hypothetical protein
MKLFQVIINISLKTILKNYKLTLMNVSCQRIDSQQVFKVFAQTVRFV